MWKQSRRLHCGALLNIQSDTSWINHGTAVLLGTCIFHFHPADSSSAREQLRMFLTSPLLPVSAVVSGTTVHFALRGRRLASTGRFLFGKSREPDKPLYFLPEILPGKCGCLSHLWLKEGEHQCITVRANPIKQSAFKSTLHWKIDGSQCQGQARRRFLYNRAPSLRRGRVETAAFAPPFVRGRLQIFQTALYSRSHISAFIVASSGVIALSRAHREQRSPLWAHFQLKLLAASIRLQY